MGWSRGPRFHRRAAGHGGAIVNQLVIGHEVQYGASASGPLSWDITGEAGPVTRNASVGGASPNHTTASATSTLLQTAGSTTWNLSLAQFQGESGSGGAAYTRGDLYFEVTTATMYDFSGWYEVAGQPFGSGMSVALIGPSGPVFLELDNGGSGPNLYILDGIVIPGFGLGFGTPSGTLAPGSYHLTIELSVYSSFNTSASGLGDLSFRFGDSVSVIRRRPALARRATTAGNRRRRVGTGGPTPVAKTRTCIVRSRPHCRGAA